MIKAIIWDIGGVLVDDSNISFWGESQESIDLRNKWGTGKMDFENFVLEASVLLNLDKKEFLKIYNEAYGYHSPHEEVIEIFKSIDLPKYILSDSNAVHTASIKKQHSEWLRFAAHIFFSQEIGMRKKSTKVFEYVLGKIGFSPEDVLFIDNKESNVDWAKKAGVNTIYYSGIDSLKSGLKKFNLFA